MAAMSGDNNDSLVEIYLASIWQYHDAGVKRVLDALRKKQPGAQCSFEEESAFFKVSCKAGDVLSVQNIFREVHSDIERGLNPKKVRLRYMPKVFNLFFTYFSEKDSRC